MDVHAQTPRARTDGLLVEEVDEETLVYDLETHEAHCLNPAAALVWRRSDGRTSVRDMAHELHGVGLPPDESLIWMALGQLEGAKLVEPVEIPGAGPRYSRKEALRTLGSAAVVVLLPVVASVVAPVAARAASCITKAECASRPPALCGGIPICGGKRSQCCLPRTKKGVTTCRNQNC